MRILQSPLNCHLGAALILGLSLSSCAEGGSGGDMEAMPPNATSTEDGLPPSIRGDAGPLGGMDLNYVPGDDVSTGYLSVPEGEGPFPGLVIVHEWNGLVDRVRQVADDLAAEGYVTLAVDLFDARTGANPVRRRCLRT